LSAISGASTARNLIANAMIDIASCFHCGEPLLAGEPVFKEPVGDGWVRQYHDRCQPAAQMVAMPTMILPNSALGPCVEDLVKREIRMKSDFIAQVTTFHLPPVLVEQAYKNAQQIEGLELQEQVIAGNIYGHTRILFRGKLLGERYYDAGERALITKIY